MSGGKALGWMAGKLIWMPGAPGKVPSLAMTDAFSAFRTCPEVRALCPRAPVCGGGVCVPVVPWHARCVAGVGGPRGPRYGRQLLPR